jgi:hypothetical protein
MSDTRVAAVNRRRGQIMAAVGLAAASLTACDFVTASSPPQPAGPVIVNNTPPDSGNSVLLTVVVIGLVVAVGVAVTFINRAQFHRARAESAERALDRFHVAHGVPNLNGQPVLPAIETHRMPAYPGYATSPTAYPNPAVYPQQAHQQIESG